jgi:cell division protein FtsI/penicillin-binding protein 2
MAQRPTPARQTTVRRAVAIGVVLVVALGVGVICAVDRRPSERDVVARYVAAWTRGDIAGMREEITAGARRRYPRPAFASLLRAAADTATATRLTAGRPVDGGDGTWRVPMRVATRAFGPVHADLRLDVVDEAGQPRIAWQPKLAFPGLGVGERLSRTTTTAIRGTLLARDGTPLARGPDRASPLGAAAAAIVGALGPIPPERRARMAALGYPPDTQVGVSGLERAFDARLLGRPGGVLRAGARVIARRPARRARAVRTTIAPSVQQAAVTALAGRLGGIVALRPRSGEILAAAGIGFSGLQPPGSTFKIITATGALEAGVAHAGDRFPIQTAAVLSGVRLQNANGESCGGTLVQAFAESCNSVFAPLGVKLGAQRLVQAAERFGFNRPTGIPAAATASIPPPGEIGDDLAVGSTAIGQGRVQATALQMAIVAATIGLRGERPQVTLDPGRWRGAAPTQRATSRRVARAVERMMLAVVRGGTGVAAAVPGVRVAGKTGTAELRTTQRRCDADPQAPSTTTAPCTLDPHPDPTDTDAWFAAYAPAGDGLPRVAVGVLLVGAGAGGDTAAPVAAQLLRAGLRR